MAKDLKLRLGQQIVYTLLSPALGVYNLFKTRNERLILWGGTFLMAILGSVYVYVRGGDGHTHKLHIEKEYMDMSVVDFFTRMGEILTLNVQQGVVDPYLHILSFISGGIFGIPELLHILAGAFYGAVYFTGVLFLLRNLDFKKASFVLGILLTVFFIYRGLTGLNAVRWWTAMWMVFSGTLGFLSTRRKKYVLLAMCSILVHFSFVGLIIPVIAGYYIRNLRKLLLILWVFSFFTAGSYEVIKPYVPEIGVFKSREATLNIDPSIQQIDSSSSNTRFYREYGETSYNNYSIPFLSFILFFFFIRNGNSNWYWSLFAMGVTLYIFANFMDFSPSVSGRAKSGSSVLILASAIQIFGNRAQMICMQQGRRMVKFLIIIFFISCIPVILFQLSYAISMMSTFTLLLPVVSWFLGDQDFSIREFLGSFL